MKQEERIGQATNSYINDILVAETVVHAEKVRCRLKKKKKLILKPSESLGGGTVFWLKLQTYKETRELVFRSGNEIPHVTDKISKRELVSTCRKMVGHYPMSEW